MADITSLPEYHANVPELLAERAWPSVTRWERVDGIPRTHTLERALRAEVRDALWMLARQWQLGELEGDDAGSPVLAKLHLGTTRLTGYRPLDGAERAFEEDVPLETRVERRSLPFDAAGQPLSLDIRLLMGRHWLKLLAKNGFGGYGEDFKRAFAVLPAPAGEAGAGVVAHKEAYQHQLAFAGRSLDGRRFYDWLIDHPAPRDLTTLPPPLAIAPGDRNAVDNLATAFLRWFDALIDQPTTEEDAWQPSRLEYQFSCSAPIGGSQREFEAVEYFGGDLDWFALDQANPSQRPPLRPEVEATRTSSFIPASVEFNGMANPRWWSFEDRRVNLGGVQPDTSDLAKLLLLEFGLVYANDWCVVPVPLDGGTLAEVQGLAVTNVFGERLWIEPAGSGATKGWQRWQMFGLSPPATSRTRLADRRLLMLPTVPKIQSGPALEEVALVRDEMANMVWGIEAKVPLPHGEGRAGGGAGVETAEFFRRLRAAPPSAPDLENDAKVRYELMTSVPEHWIPFVPVHVPDDNREIQLQRASLPRVIENDPGPILRIKPRTSLLREGLDLEEPVPYFVHEEEVPRAGIRVEQTYQRTRWHDGRAHVWLGVTKKVGRGEGSSGLEFDRLVEMRKR